MPAGVGRTAGQGQHDLSASLPLGNTLTSLLMRPDGPLFYLPARAVIFDIREPRLSGAR